MAQADMPENTEAEIVRACQRGDDSAFGALYDRHAPTAFRTAILLLGDHQAAEEALQDAFIRAFRAIGRFRAESPFRPWFTRILVNECRRRGRRVATARSELSPVEVDGKDSAVSQTHDLPDDWVEHMEVREAVAQLPTPYREAIVLHYFDGLTVPEMAAALGCPEGTIKFRLFEGRRRLHEILTWERGNA